MARKQRFLSINFTIEGVEEIAVDLNFIGRELNDFSEPLQKSNALLRKAIAVNFKSEGVEFGEKWKELAPSTLKQKARLGFGAKQKLERTGRLKKGWKSQLSKSSLEISNPTSYFGFHQSNENREKLPRRIMLKIDEKRNAEIVEQFTIFLNKTTNRFGN